MFRSFVIALATVAMALRAEAFPSGATPGVSGSRVRPPASLKCVKGDPGCGHTHQDFDFLVGKRFMKDAMAKEDAESGLFFTASEIPAGSRIIYPNTPVTKDFRRERLNVHVNGEGVAQRVIFG